jgi:hypothetical protein
LHTHPVWPVAAEYEPGAQAQAEHAEAAGAALKSPAPQAVQPTVPVVSALYPPAAHEVQPVAAVSVLYAPAAQAVHPDTAGMLLYDPTLQAVQAVAPAGCALYVPAVQLKQYDALEACVRAL